MKKALLTLLVGLAGCVLAQAAPYTYTQSNEGWYVAGNLSMGTATNPDISISPAGTGEIDTDLGYGIALAGGYEWDGLRLELEYAFRHNDGNIKNNTAMANQNANFAIHSLMVNALYDYYLTDEVYWYNGMGLGLAFAKLSSPGGSDSDTVLAWQMMTGIGYDLTENIAITFGYRLFTTRDPDLTIGGNRYNTETPIISSVELGMRYNF